ncbi:MAG: hypothetical protein OEU84_04115 [Xanthomonadales bacterium]|nr:hypothetical protein [Xanthomonadales bacterium]
MLTYATILIVSLIVAVVALFLYKVISDSSRSVYSSKDRIAIIDRHPQDKKAEARHSAVSNAMDSIDRKGGAAWNMTKSTPAMAVGSSPRDELAPGQFAHQGAGVAESSHCSLYDVSPAKPEGNNSRQPNWIQREEKSEPGGKVYKVKRRSTAGSTDPQSGNKPWGW